MPVATYFQNADCVEFLSEDTTAIYRRVDEFLTLIFDDTRLRLIGLKLKGFRSIHDQMVEAGELAGGNNFRNLVPALEAVTKRVAEAMVNDPARRRSYDAARKFTQGIEPPKLAAAM
tara:strand:- start:5331 stop:5681 length:351 start_codon:yes stop_codon:yes gene_type:complete